MFLDLLENLSLRAIFFAAISFFIVIFLVPPTIRIASKLGFLDKPGARKVHVSPVPRLGGIAIFLGFWISWGAFLFLFSDVVPFEAQPKMRALFVGSLAIFFLGLYDDLWGANAFKKLFVQVLAAVWVVWHGVSIEYVYNPVTDSSFSLNSSMFSWALAVFWIVLVTNAINLIDGLDGLAAGVCFITSVTLFFISRDLGIPHLPYMCACLAGALLAFLIFNFSPARIFLGDSGALVLGFVLACLSIEGTVKRSTAIVMFGPPLILALPALDTIFAILRRFLSRAKAKDLGSYRDVWRPRFLINRIRGIFAADQSHIHHGLLKIGLSHRRAVLILYCVTALLSASAYRVAVQDHLMTVFIALGGLSFLLWCLVRKAR